MHITVCCSDTKVEPWVEALCTALPEARVEAWTPGAPQADYAVVWAPPQQFLDEQSGLKAIFNIGAGVDGVVDDSGRMRKSLGVVAVEQRVVRRPSLTSASVQARFTPSCSTLHNLWPRNGGIWCAESPARKTLPTRISIATAAWNR